MADNATAPGTGLVFATDDIGSVHHPYFKAGFGADGTFTKVEAAVGMPVDPLKFGNLVVPTAAFTRPSDTTTYATNDAVNNSTSAPVIMTFADVVAANGGTGYIVGARMHKNSNVTTNAAFRLHILHTTMTMINDNSLLTLLFADRTKRVGFIDFVCGTEGTGSDSAEAFDYNVRMPFKCAAADDNLYGVLQAKAGYIPTSAEQFYFELYIDRN